MWQKFLKLKNDKNFIRLIFIIGIVGILLIFCSTLFTGESKEEASASLTEYEEKQEERIEDLINQIEGVGNAKVMVTMESSGEQVYTNDTLVKEMQPVVRGVVIACDGADTPTVKESVVEVVIKAFNISADKVCVIKLKEE
jgi:stage III sporulation protein AG